MLKTESALEDSRTTATARTCRIAVSWIDWYAYHLARFRALCENRELAGSVAGLEMVGGTGVHSGLKFREEIPSDYPVTTLLPDVSWHRASKRHLARLIWRELDRLNPSIVLVPGYYNVAGFAAALWGRWHGRRTVLMTESTEFDHARSSWKESLKGLLIRSLFDWAIAGGSPHQRYLEKLGFRPERIANFYDVVDNDFFSRSSASIRLQSRAYDFGLPERYFLYVGRLAEEKNIDGLLASYEAYRLGGGTWPLVLVGEGPESQNLRSLAEQSTFRSDIYFEGLKTSKELPTYYAFAGCFVLPSTREPWGLVVNEAMAAGLPVIVSRHCGCAEDLVRQGKNGHVFDPLAKDELTEALRSIDRLDAPDLRAMGDCSSEIVAKFSPEAWAGEVARIANAQ